MKKNQNLRAIQAQRFLRYSIRKFTVGVASVAIASGLAVLGGTNVQAAAEEVVNTHATETKAPETGKNIKTEVAEKVNTSKLSEAIARLRNTNICDTNQCQYNLWDNWLVHKTV